MDSARGFRRAFLSMLLGNFGAACVGALTMIIGIRVLSPEDWASAAIIVGLGPALGVALSLGSVTFLVRGLARDEVRSSREAAYATFLARRLGIGAALLVVAASIAMAGSEVYAWVALLAGVRFVRAGTSVLMSAERRFGALAALNMVEKLVALAIMIGWSWFAAAVPYTALPYSFLISYLVFGFIAVVLERPSAGGQAILMAARTPWLVWRGSGTFGLTSLAGPLQQADVSVLALVSDSLQAGLLAAGSRLTGGLNVVGGALASVVLPYFSGTRPRIQRRAIWRLLALVACCGIGFVIVALTASLWVPLALGDQYRAAIRAIALYVILAFLLTLSQPLIALLQAWDAERTAMVLSLLQASLGLVSVAVCGALGGATAAAAGQVVVAGFFVVALVVCVVRRARSMGLR